MDARCLLGALLAVATRAKAIIAVFTFAGPVLSITHGCRLSTDSDWVQVASLSGASCGLRDDGTAECWGCKTTGLYGSSGAEDVCSTAPDEAFVAIDASPMCGLTTSGELVCWSDSGARTISWPEPFVALGGSCALTEDLDAVCGIGDLIPHLREGPFRAIDGYGDRVCAVDEDGALACWGCTEDLDEAACDAQAGEFVDVGVGGFHRCGLAADGKVHCWGCEPAEVDGGQCEPPDGDFVALSVGVHQVCAVGRRGFVRCWGRNDRGQSLDPPGRFDYVDCGVWHNCGVHRDGHVRCWGCDPERPARKGIDEGQCSPP